MKFFKFISNVFLTDRQSKNDDFLNRSKLMSVNDKIAEPKVYTAIYLAVSVCFLILMNYVGKIFVYLPYFMGVKEKDSTISFNPFTPTLPIWYYALLLIFIVVFYFVVAYKIKISYEQLNIGQKGTSRFTTREELREQFKSVPEKKERFPGNGGIPIARDGDWLYIDDSPVNNLIIGMTRSGKGETVVFPTIDIYSRAENQASLIITDPKLELSAAAIPTLVKRGYEYHILNLVDPEYSMGYNPLHIILDEFKNGDPSIAQNLCGSFCYSIFNPEEAGENKFFEDNSTSLLSALILAQIDDCLKADRMLNEKRKYEVEQENKRRKEEALNKLSAKEKDLYLTQEKIDYYIGENGISPGMPLESLAANIGMDIDRLKEIMSMDKIKIDYQEKKFTPIAVNEKKVNRYSIISTFSTLTSKQEGKKTMLDIYFERRPEGDIAKNLYASTGSAGEKTKGSIYSNMLTKLKVFTYNNIAKMTAESTVDFKNVGFGKKPVVIFIGMPDYDTSNYFLVSTFVKQLYFTLAKMATHSPTGKCYREVVFLLDEFGNIPALDDMQAMTTVCLGRNIRFDFVIQSYQQLEEKYPHSWKAILDNCGNKIYILTASTDTAEEYSKLIGSHTQTTVNRTGKMFSLNKERTEMQEERRLIDANELTKLMPGETIVARSMKRTDLKGNPVRPHPISNLGKYRMKYRYEYLIDDFPSGNILYDSENVRKTFEMIREIQKDRIKNGWNEKLIGEPVPISVNLEDTSLINLSERIWSAEQFVRDYKATLAERTEPASQHSFFNLLNLSGSAQNKYVTKSYLSVIDDIYNEYITSPNKQVRLIGVQAYSLIADSYDYQFDEEAEEKAFIVSEVIRNAKWEYIKDDIPFRLEKEKQEKEEAKKAEAERKRLKEEAKKAEAEKLKEEEKRKAEKSLMADLGSSTQSSQKRQWEERNEQFQEKMAEMQRRRSEDFETEFPNEKSMTQNVSQNEGNNDLKLANVLWDNLSKSFEREERRVAASERQGALYRNHHRGVFFNTQDFSENSEAKNTDEALNALSQEEKKVPERKDAPEPPKRNHNRMRGYRGPVNSAVSSGPEKEESSASIVAVNAAATTDDATDTPKRNRNKMRGHRNPTSKPEATEKKAGDY